MKKRILYVACLMLLLTGCKSIPKLSNGDEVILSLDGKEISANEFYEKLKEGYGADLLINMADEWIANNEIKTTDDIKKAVDEEYEETKKQYEDYYQVDFSEILTQSNYTEESFKNYLLITYKQKLIIENYAKDLITDEEVQNYYDKNISGKITARHILITPDVTSTMNDKEKETKKKEAYDLAKSLIDQINNGSDFSELAKQYSKDTVSALNGGLLDEFDNNSNLVPEFLEAAIKLEVGKYTTEPVESQYGYHIILKEKEENKKSFEESKDEIKTTLANQKIQEDSTLSYKALYEARKKYNMTINDSDILNKYNEAVKDYE